METSCISCGRSGSAYKETNYIFECSRCEYKRTTQQVWWIRLLQWLVK